MAEDLEDYINKGHVEVLVEALKYSMQVCLMRQKMK